MAVLIQKNKQSTVCVISICNHQVVVMECVVNSFILLQVNLFHQVLQDQDHLQEEDRFYHQQNYKQEHHQFNTEMHREIQFVNILWHRKDVSKERLVIDHTMHQ